MQIFKNKLEGTLTYDFSPQYNKEDILFFDIETTGFSAETTVLYLIGCVYYKDNSWNSIQWFADNNTSELDMLTAFFNFLSSYKLLIHYNGDGFDIPYISKKCNKYQLNHNFSQIHSFDIYKKIQPYKKFLKLENLKQKTVEKFLDIQRNDVYSGGELIQIYGSYLKGKYCNSPDTENLLHFLLLHNKEDIHGMLKLTTILNYCDIFKKDITVYQCSIEENELILNITLPCSLPKRISFGNDTFYFLAYQENGTLRIKLYKDELKFFYSNYKDYYYLPEEDTAIHKSVAFYVDKDFRTKAKAANCYSKKSGSFVPQFRELISPYFKIDYFDKISYVETTQELLEDKDRLAQYAKHILEHM